MIWVLCTLIVTSPLPPCMPWSYQTRQECLTEERKGWEKVWEANGVRREDFDSEWAKFECRRMDSHTS